MPFRRKKKKEEKKEEERFLKELVEEMKVEEVKKEEEAPKPIYMEEKVLVLEITENAKIEAKKTTAKGLLKIRNESYSPISSVEVELENVENTNLGKNRIFIPFLPRAGEINSEISYEYNIVKMGGNPIKIEEIIRLENTLENEPIIVRGEETTGTFVIKIENLTDEEISDVIIRRTLPRHFSIFGPQGLNVKLLENSIIEGNTGPIPPKGIAEVSFGVKVFTKEKGPIDLGILEYSTVISKTISGITVKKFEGRAIVNTSVKAVKRADSPDVWDVTLEIENPNDFSVIVSGSISPAPGVRFIAEETPTGVTLSEGAIKIESLVIGERGRRSFGPFPVRSAEFPEFNVDLTAIVRGVVDYHGEMKSSLKRGSLPVLWADVSKSVKVKHEKALQELLEPNEVPSSGVTPVTVSLTITNKGSADIGYISIEETIPAGFENPSVVDVKRGTKTVNASISISPETVGIDSERKLLIEIQSANMEGPLRPGESIKITYEMKANNPTPRDYVPLSNITRVSTSPNNRILEMILSEEKTPVLRIKEIIKQIEISKSISIKDADVYEVTVKIFNGSNVPVVNYKYREFVPATFEVLATNPSAKSTQKSGGVMLEWKIDKIPPQHSFNIVYVVKGIGEYRIDELMKVRAA